MLRDSRNGDSPQRQHFILPEGRLAVGLKCYRVLNCDRVLSQTTEHRPEVTGVAPRPWPNVLLDTLKGFADSGYTACTCHSPEYRTRGW